MASGLCMGQRSCTGYFTAESSTGQCYFKADHLTEAIILVPHSIMTGTMAPRDPSEVRLRILSHNKSAHIAWV